jgi:hypothetical protein
MLGAATRACRAIATAERLDKVLSHQEGNQSIMINGVIFDMDGLMFDTERM